MNLKELETLMDLEELNHFPGGRNTIYKWSDPQGSSYGTRGLGFVYDNPNNEAPLRKDDWSSRGTLPGFRMVDNSKKRGLKSLPKKVKRQSIRFGV